MPKTPRLGGTLAALTTAGRAYAARVLRPAYSYTIQTLPLLGGGTLRDRYH